MTLVLALAGCAGEAAIIYALIILARLSEKLGAVTKMRPYYRGFYLSVALLCLSLASRLVRISAVLTEAGQSVSLLEQEGFYLLTHHLPMALGMLIAILVAGRYWGWLLKE
ncbi:MAG: hypothetical protein H5T59_02920 [Anaerolineae bacterium]|nr:hypothetical protein [Anaerolineae bacterium]